MSFNPDDMQPRHRASFWAKVTTGDDGCWLWTASKDGMGYGLFGRIAGQIHRSHRISWVLAHGPIPDGLCVLHRCDTPNCVRPAHLFLGTRDENMRDRQAKQRQARGERAGRALLTEADVREMRQLRSEGALIKELAARYGVKEATVGHACTRRSWRHI